MPYYHEHSNGIKILWEIAYQFSLLNKNMHVLEAPWGPKIQRPKKYDSLLIDKSFLAYLDDPIVIYPDIFNDNPLNAKRIVRFLLAKPFSFGNEFTPQATDYVATFSQVVLDKRHLDQFYFLNNELNYFKNINIKGKKNLVSIYYGKCRVSDSYKYLLDIINQFEFVEIITRSTPDNQEDLHRILSQSKLLISFDAFSHITLIANIYGTPVLFTDNIFIEVFRSFNQKIYGYYYKNDIGKLKKIMSVGNMQRISQSTVSEIKRIKSSEKRVFLRFYDAIIRHFKKVKNLAYHKQNYNKLEVAKMYFENFNQDYWKKNLLFVVMNRSTILAFHLVKYKFLFKLLISLNKLRLLMIGAIKKIVSIFTFQTKSKVEDIIFTNDKDLKVSIPPLKNKNKNKLINNKFLLNILWRI